MNTQVLDGCESAHQSGDQMEDYLEKGIALDSDDEGENQNEAVNSVRSYCVGGRLSGRHALGLLRRQQAPAGYFQRLNKVSEHVLPGLGSAISGRSDEESTAGGAGFCNVDGFQEHRVVVNSVVSRSSQQKPVLTDSVNAAYSIAERESSMEELHDRKLPSHESKCMTMGKDANYDCKTAELSYFDSPQVADLQDKVMQFVDEYISVCDLGSYKDIPTKKTGVIKSPPPLRSMGIQSLARRLTLGSTASKLTTFDWAEPVEMTERASLRLHNDSTFGFRSDKCGSVSVDRESPCVNFHNEISILQPEEKLPGNMSNPNNLDTVLLSSSECTVPDSIELDEQLDAGISSQNADNIERYRLTPEEPYVGLDTQMAAEAMEELVHANPPRVDSCFIKEGSHDTLLDSSNAVNKNDKSNLASHEVAFVDWRGKEKRSKSRKIPSVQDKRLSMLPAKRSKNQRGIVCQSVAGKKLMTKRLMADEQSFHKRNQENTTNRSFDGRSRIIVQQEEYGSTERWRSKKLQNLDRLCKKLQSKIADGVKYEPAPKGIKITSSFHGGAHRKGIKTCLRSDSGPSAEVKPDSAEGKENCSPNVADMTLLELTPWVYPKRKRTPQCTSSLATSPSNQCLPFSVVGESGGGAAKLLVYNRRRKVSLGKELTGNSLKIVVDLRSPVNISAVPDKKVHTQSYPNKTLKQCGTPDDASINIKSEGNAKRKRSQSPVSVSPLMKELMILGYADSLPDFLPKDSRRRRATDKVCILFSQNLDTCTLKQQKKIVARLGFSIASSSSDATHFVADRFIRTRNMLEVIGLGKPVVTHLWLESCEQAGYLINEKSYILRDEKKEKEFGFNMHVTLTRASQLPLLKGRRVLVTPNVKPCLEVINSLVEVVQGQVVQMLLNAKTMNELIHSGLLILSSEEDYIICSQFLKKGASIYDSELLLNGIVTQKLEYERYRLFNDVQ